MKFLFFLLLTFLFTIQSNAQNSVIGKWRPLKIDIPTLGEMPVKENELRDYLYQKTTGDKNDSLTKEDSVEIENLVQQVQQQFATLTIEFKVDKTYKALVDGKMVTGTYVYNATTKTLITKPKAKPSKTASISFTKGVLRMENKEDKLILFLERMK